MSVPRTVLGFNTGQPYIVGGTDAGEPLRPLHRIADACYRDVLGQDIEVLTDTPANSWGIAWYRGVNERTNLGRYAVRDDVVLNKKIAHHENTHELEDRLRRLTGADWWNILSVGSVDVLGEYWRWRGFPGTWQDAHMQAIAMGEWGRYPSESFAEAGSLAVIGPDDPYVFAYAEWTVNYNRPLLQPFGLYDPITAATRARGFFLGLVDKITQREDVMTPQQEAKLDRVLALLEAEGPKVWIARTQRDLDVETGQPFNPASQPIDPRIRQ